MMSGGGEFTGISDISAAEMVHEVHSQKGSSYGSGDVSVKLEKQL